MPERAADQDAQACVIEGHFRGALRAYTSLRRPSRRVAVWLGLGLALASCDQGLTSSSNAIDPPACTSVSRFGNGASCSSGEPSLAACGTSPTRLCAGGWLCYDAVGYEQCACSTDADCAGKRDYVNQARALYDKAPVAMGCHGGRCLEGP